MTMHLNYIAGRWTSGNSSALTSTSPSNGDIIAQGHFSSKEEASAAVEAAAAAAPSWSQTPFDERIEVIKSYAAIALDRKEEMARLIATESGKALWDARTEAGAIAGKADISITAYHERTPTRDEGAMRLTHRPHGVMCVIGPFNFPGHLPNGHIIPALIAGNTVVFKPSEKTPAVARLMVSWWEEAGLPAGVLNLVQGGADIATTIITHAKSNGTLFTGGAAAGLAIHKSLAGHPEKILALELGGNNPLIGWDVADAEGFATVVARSAYISAGQRCTCSRRLIVPMGAEGDRLVDAVAAVIPKLSVGDPLAEPQPFYGSVIDARAASLVLGAQSQMESEGAKLLVEARTAKAGEAFVTPGLIDTTDWRAQHDEEIFGPFLQVIRTESFEAAIAAANDTRFGLAAGLLSDDPAKWQTFRDQIHAGIVNWNRQTTGASGKAPFGGPGLSGNHRPAGYYAADYCAWPMASMVQEGPLNDDVKTEGLLA